MASQYLYPSNIYKLKYNIIMMVLNANALVRWLGQEDTFILFYGIRKTIIKIIFFYFFTSLVDILNSSKTWLYFSNDTLDWDDEIENMLTQITVLTLINHPYILFANM